jgi:hypothetical protein
MKDADEATIEQAKHEYRKLLVLKAKAAKIKNPTPEQMTVIVNVEDLIRKFEEMAPELVKDIQWEDLSEIDSLWEEGLLETKFENGKEYVRITEKGKKLAKKLFDKKESD